MENHDDLDEIVNAIDAKNFGAVVFHNKGESIEYTAILPDAFLGDNDEKSYHTMVNIIALMRKVSEYLTTHAANFANIEENEVKQDVATVYYDFKKNNIIFEDEDA